MATRLALTLTALLACCHCTAQLTIEECYAKARSNYPTAKQYGLIDKAEAYNISNAAKGYLPQVALTAQATYQSDVTKLPFDESLLAPMGISMPTLSKDQYKVALDMSQTIWDGGGIRARQKATRAGAEAERRQADVSLYQLRARVNQLFFGILLIEAQLEQNGLLRGVLQRNCNRTKAYISGGVANDADLDALSVELLKARQDSAQLAHTRRAYAAMLGQLTGLSIADSTRLVRPEATAAGAHEATGRPELALYEAQMGSLRAEGEGVTAGLMPRLSLFATGGYGKPGLNMLEDRFRLYGVAGVRLQWNIGSLYTLRDSRRRIAADMERVENSRRAFLLDTRMEATGQRETIRRLEDQISYDGEIIRLRRNVRLASEAKMAGGTIDGTDLARDIDAEQQAVKAKMVHEVELLEAIYHLKYVTNN